MENVFNNIRDNGQEKNHEGRVYVPFPGADEKYDDGRDWRIYNPGKYRDPNWSPEKE
ncbi:MAG: hypothetical protein PHX58_03205 [Desulfovibrio sp.]|nr:hypothetical protein [Desulfovibrio sp.]